jgi:hypothetical protein
MINEMDSQYIYPYPYLKNIKVFSPIATADEEILFDKKEEKLIFDPKKVENGKFLRTIGTDTELTDALVDELQLRGINLHCEQDNEEKTNHIILISEWDTIYGQMLPLSFAKSVT